MQVEVAGHDRHLLEDSERLYWQSLECLVNHDDEALDTTRGKWNVALVGSDLGRLACCALTCLSRSLRRGSFLRILLLWCLGVGACSVVLGLVTT